MVQALLIANYNNYLLISYEMRLGKTIIIITI
jgi:hypothetical protein